MAQGQGESLYAAQPTGLWGNALVALGANLPSPAGPPAATLAAALAEMGRRGLRLRAISRFFHTPCFPAGAGPDYVNAAVGLEHAGGPEALLALLHEVEAAFARTRAERWGMRTLDLDLLAYGAEVRPDMAGYRAWRDLPPEAQRQRAPDRLVLPHPRLADRAFVLVPLMDIAPGWRNPVDGRSVSEMCAALPAAQRAEVAAL